MKYTLIFSSILFFLFSSSTYAEPTDLKTVGKAEMRWLMFPLYQVALKTSDGRYQENRYPQVLDILYRRDISKQDLLAATDDQWSRLGVPTEKRQQWIQQLDVIWPSIKRGDRLSFEVGADLKNYFNYNGKRLGGINDDSFGRSFLAIWLSDRTSQPNIRQLLIGATP